MLALPGVNTVPPPMDLGASVSDGHVASEMYLVLAVALPSMLVILIGLRILSAPARWAGWGPSDNSGWAWRMPYEVFVIAFPIAATAVGEWLAIAALASGSNGSTGANRLLFVAAAGLLIMGISSARSLPRLGRHASDQQERWSESRAGGT